MNQKVLTQGQRLKNRDLSKAAWTEAFGSKEGNKPGTVKTLYTNTSALFNGKLLTFQPILVGDDGKPKYNFPNEETTVQLTVKRDILPKMQKLFGDLVKCRAATDQHNMLTVADLVIDGNVVAKQLPATAMISARTEFRKLREEILLLPVTDIKTNWGWDEQRKLWETAPTVVNKTQKERVVLTKAKATTNHPEQVETYDKDVVVGTNTTIYFSGAARQTEIQDMISRIDQVIEGLDQAIVAANTTSASVEDFTSSLTDYIFNGTALPNIGQPA